VLLLLPLDFEPAFDWDPLVDAMAVSSILRPQTDLTIKTSITHKGSRRGIRHRRLTIDMRPGATGLDPHPVV
jgi:hypothetical protein